MPHDLIIKKQTLESIKNISSPSLGDGITRIDFLLYILYIFYNKFILLLCVIVFKMMSLGKQMQYIQNFKKQIYKIHSK